MSARISGLGAAILLALSAPAAAQVASAPLGQLDPWGVGWLSKTEGALPTSIWSNTTSDALAPLYASLQPQQLSPAGRAALRRVALSSAKGPADGAALIPERLRVIEQLGETERSIDLRKRFPDTAWGKQYERTASGYELILNRSEAACPRATAKRGDNPDWMPVRALCLALAGDFNAASLAAEHVPPGADGKNDVWLLAAIATMEAPARNKPEGRYATPLDAAVSVAAKLSAPASALAATPADVAAAIVQHPGATLEQKRAALRPALDGGRLKPADVLAVLTAKDETPTAKPASGRATAPRTDFLALALNAAGSTDAKPNAKATAFAAALKSAETPSDFRLAAFALLDPIKALPKNDATAPNAETFARVALLAGDTKTAQDWRKEMDEKADPWAAARIDLMLSYTGVGAGKPGEILDRLLAALPPLPEASKEATAAKAATPATRQLDLRRIENTRVLFLYAGTGRDLAPEQRALLLTQKAAGRGVSDAALASIGSAIEAGANGEAALASISLLGPDVSALSFAGLADILTQLRRVGLEKDAEAIALEALQLWKTL
jgi:hypothetical protein